jgi:hypothetical protein
MRCHFKSVCEVESDNASYWQEQGEEESPTVGEEVLETFWKTICNIFSNYICL